MSFLFQRKVSYGPFEVVRLVALGSGHGEGVPRARQAHRRARRAYKVLEGAADLARFEREAHILANAIHANIVRYVQHGVSSRGEPWLAMEWLEGEDLAARLDRGPLSLAAALLVGRAVAGVLGYAHARSLTHRDLKPGNVYLVDGDVARVRVLDFGIARDPRRGGDHRPPEPSSARRAIHATGAGHRRQARGRSLGHLRARRHLVSTA